MKIFSVEFSVSISDDLTMNRELNIFFIIIATIPFFVKCGVNNPNCELGQVNSGGLVACEIFRKMRVNQFGYTVQSICYMEKKSRIISTGYEIDTRKIDHVIGIVFDYNFKIFYLPEKVHKKFPNLQGISAENCSVKSISRNNFAKLPSLSVLLLNGNKITAITSDTFVDNINLLFIDLSE